MPIPKCHKNLIPPTINLYLFVDFYRNMFRPIYLIIYNSAYLSPQIIIYTVSQGKSTPGALLAATHAWHLALDGGSDVCYIFLDLSKAFNKVPHIP